MIEPRWSKTGNGRAVVMACAALAMFCPSQAPAAPLDIINAGFEDNSVGTALNEFTFGAPAGWALYDPGNITDNGDGPTYFVGTLTPTEIAAEPGVIQYFPGGAAEGQRVGIAFNFSSGGGDGEYGLVQTLDDTDIANTLQPNTTYTLQVEIGNIASGTSVNNAEFDLDGFPGYRVDLLAGGTVLASDNNTLAGSIPEGEFATSTIVFDTGANHEQLGQALGIRLVNLNVIDADHSDADLEVDFDDVRLNTSPIPEPASLALMAAGVAVLIRRG